jgi:Sec-independent protein translocase protein TatA
MLSLSPTKIIVVLVLGLLLLGPDKLPQVSRQIGGVWKEISRFRERVESTVRESLPDLPATSDIAKMARSPVSFLNSLAEMPDTRDDLVEDPGAAEVGGYESGVQQVDHWPTDSAAESDTTGIPAKPLGTPRPIFRASPSSEPAGSPSPIPIPSDPSLN